MLEVVEDANTILRKEGIEEVVAKYPDVNIIQESPGLKQSKKARKKFRTRLPLALMKLMAWCAPGM